MKSLPALTSILAIFFLGGCSPVLSMVASSHSPSPTSASPSPSPSPSSQDFSLGPVAPDATMVIKAVALAANGSKMAVEMRVRQSVPVDDIGSHTVPDALISACGQVISPATFATDRWSFTRVNVSAVSSSGEWPADARINLQPSATKVPIASMSFLSEASGADGSAQCRLDKYFASAGKGAVSIGLPHDAQTNGKQFTGWASHSFGFTAGTGVTLSDCSIQVTQNGERLGGSGISQIPAGAACINLIPAEGSVF